MNGGPSALFILYMGGWIRPATLLALLASGCLPESEKSSSSSVPDGAPVVAGSGAWPLVYASGGHPVRALSLAPAEGGLEVEVETLANGHRVSMGLSALQADPALREVSRAHSVHMGLHPFFAHQNPELDTPLQRARSAGIPFASWGENIAAGQATAATVLADWLSSPGHKQNLERPDWTHHGVGYAYEASGGYHHYWTHSFRIP